MEKIEFSRAFYIKLGVGGKLEKSSINDNSARIGWAFLQLEENNGRDWEAIKIKHKGEYANQGAATKDINALKLIVDSTSDDIWITFHASQEQQELVNMKENGNSSLTAPLVINYSFCT